MCYTRWSGQTHVRTSHEVCDELVGLGEDLETAGPVRHHALALRRSAGAGGRGVRGRVGDRVGDRIRGQLQLRVAAQVRRGPEVWGYSEVTVGLGNQGIDPNPAYPQSGGEEWDSPDCGAEVGLGRGTEDAICGPGLGSGARGRVRGRRGGGSTAFVPGFLHSGV